MSICYVRMSFQDFCKYFTTMEMCSMGPDSMSQGLAEGENKNRWEATQDPGQWVRRVNAGGCRNFLGEFFSLSGFLSPSHFFPFSPLSSLHHPSSLLPNPLPPSSLPRSLALSLPPSLPRSLSPSLFHYTNMYLR